MYEELFWKLVNWSENILLVDVYMDDDKEYDRSHYIPNWFMIIIAHSVQNWFNRILVLLHELGHATNHIREFEEDWEAFLDDDEREAEVKAYLYGWGVYKTVIPQFPLARRTWLNMNVIAKCRKHPEASGKMPMIYRQ